MTAAELLEAAKARFVVLYHREDTALQGLLKKALGTYQEKAGVIVKLLVREGTTVSPPGHLLDIAIVHDKRRVYVPYEIEDGNIILETTCETVYPITIHYFVNLRSYIGTQDNLPGGCIDLCTDYLQALIAIPNAARERKVLLSTDQQAADVQDPTSLTEVVMNIEQAMEDRKAMLPPVAVY